MVWSLGKRSPLKRFDFQDAKLCMVWSLGKRSPLERFDFQDAKLRMLKLEA